MRKIWFNLLEFNGSNLYYPYKCACCNAEILSIGISNACMHIFLLRIGLPLGPMPHSQELQKNGQPFISVPRKRELGLNHSHLPQTIGWKLRSGTQSPPKTLTSDESEKEAVPKLTIFSVTLWEKYPSKKSAQMFFHRARRKITRLAGYTGKVF